MSVPANPIQASGMTTSHTQPNSRFWRQTTWRAAGIVASLVVGAWPALEHFGPGFITRVEWDPVNDEYGALIAIAGTLITSLLALLIAFPVSFGIALFLTEICPTWLKRPLGTAVE